MALNEYRIVGTHQKHKPKTYTRIFPPNKIKHDNNNDLTKTVNS